MASEKRQGATSEDHIGIITRLITEEIEESTSYGLIVSITKATPVEVDFWGSKDATTV